MHQYIHKQCGNSSVVEHNLAKVGVASSNLVSRLFLAGWQSGYAAACKAADAGSIPASAYYSLLARVAKLVDARDLKSLEIISRAGSTPAPGTL